ncbi:hypothetical protein AAC387_Pa05g2038 [Persea americana]
MAKRSKLKPDDKLLYAQDSHVSKAILNGVEPGAYRCINTNPDKDIWELTDRQKEIVRDVGLANISEIDYMRINYALISGLVERWRPETNTFHLPTGKATVTLKDVAYIYGLPIDGILVTGRTFPKSLVSEVCKELLVIAPCPGKDTIGITIKFKWLEDNFKPFKKSSEIYKTRAYLFFLVYGQIFVNSSDVRGPAWQLELFREFKSYAWGPAYLASLYGMLGRATMLLKGEEGSKKTEEGEDKCNTSKITLTKTLTGPLQLLQVMQTAFE